MREVRFDMGREVILTLGGFKFLREYFKDLLPRGKKKKNTHNGSDFCTWARSKVKT